MSNRCGGSGDKALEEVSGVPGSRNHTSDERTCSTTLTDASRTRPYRTPRRVASSSSGARATDVPSAHRELLCVLATELGTRYKAEGDAVAAQRSYEEAIRAIGTVQIETQESEQINLNFGKIADTAAGNAGSGTGISAAAAVAAPALYNLGLLAAERGDRREARRWYEFALAASPEHAESHCNLGVLAMGDGDLEGACVHYRAALRVAPRMRLAMDNLAAALCTRGAAAKASSDDAAANMAATTLFEEAVTESPLYAAAHYNLATALADGGDIKRAKAEYQLAILLSPSMAQAHNNLGVLLRAEGDMEGACECYAAAVAADPCFVQALSNLAVCRTMEGHQAEALALLERAARANPSYADTYNNVGVLKRDAGDVAGAISAYNACLAADPARRTAKQNRLLCANYIVEDDADGQLYEAHAAWGEEFSQRFAEAAVAGGSSGAGVGSSRDDRESTDCRLSVGYLCSDLFTHSVSYFAEAPLLHHDPDAVRMVVYNTTPHADARTALLRKAVVARHGNAAWHECGERSEEDVAAMVRADAIDVLVELGGHTANNKLGVLACRAAPTQVTWIGYPNTTGLCECHYRLTDALCDPHDTSQRFTEQLVRLPRCFLCYTPPRDAPSEVADTPALAHGLVTFGSFNALAKVTPRVLRLWAGVLHAVPQSRLLLKSKAFACETSRAAVLAGLSAVGVDGARVDLLPLHRTMRDHLASYALMDIALDTWPYAGTTTTCEAMHMGVPVVTLRGRTHAANVGVSLLGAVGLDHLAAEDDAGYVEAARALAADVGALQALRKGMRARLSASPLYDAPRFVGKLEETLRALCYERAAEAAAKATAGDEGGAAAGGVGETPDCGRGGKRSAEGEACEVRGGQVEPRRGAAG